jgi:hypothetical protein
MSLEGKNMKRGKYKRKRKKGERNRKKGGKKKGKWEVKSKMNLK